MRVVCARYIHPFRHPSDLSEGDWESLILGNAEIFHDQILRCMPLWLELQSSDESTPSHVAETKAVAGSDSIYISVSELPFLGDLIG